jgi:hypothetical protein
MLGGASSLKILSRTLQVVDVAHLAWLSRRDADVGTQLNQDRDILSRLSCGLIITMVYLLYQI